MLILIKAFGCYMSLDLDGGPVPPEVDEEPEIEVVEMRKHSIGFANELEDNEEIHCGQSR